MTLGGNSFNDFPKLYRPQKSQPKQRRLFSFSRRWPCTGLLLERAQCCSSNGTHLHPALNTNAQYNANKLSPRGWRDDMLPADSSSTRGGSTSVRGRLRSLHTSGGWQAAGSQRAYSLGSCVMQPACLQPRLGQTDGRIAVPPNVPHTAYRLLFTVSSSRLTSCN